MHEIVLRDTPFDLVPEGLVLLQELLVCLPVSRSRRHWVTASTVESRGTSRITDNSPKNSLASGTRRCGAGRPTPTWIRQRPSSMMYIGPGGSPRG